MPVRHFAVKRQTRLFSQPFTRLFVLTLGAFCIVILLPNSLLASGVDLDPTFGSGGKVITKIDNSSSVIFDLAIQPDGRIVTVGWSGAAGVTLARYNSNGSLDTSFGTNGIAGG